MGIEKISEFFLIDIENADIMLETERLNKPCAHISGAENKDFHIFVF